MVPLLRRSLVEHPPTRYRPPFGRCHFYGPSTTAASARRQAARWGTPRRAGRGRARSPIGARTTALIASGQSCARSAPHARIDAKLATQLVSIGDPLTVLSANSTLASAIQTDNGCGDVIAGYESATGSGLKVGDCTTPNEGKVACTQPHDDEVTLVTSYPASSTAPFPGNDAIQSFVDQNCAAAFSSYVGISADQSSHTYGWFSPNVGADWNSGDREIVCTVTNQDNTPSTGSARGQAS